jgi:alpha-tubulin suppressor-like RCC1 family protein
VASVHYSRLMVLMRETFAPGKKLLAVAAGLGLALVPMVSASGSAARQSAAAGRVAFWGTFANAAHLSPVTVRLPAPVAEVGTSNTTVYALLTDGSVYAWGAGKRGQLGDGGTTSSFTKPVRVKFPVGVRIASIAVNSDPFDTAFAVDTTGHAWGWGDNGSGDLCLGNSIEHRIPVRLPFTHVSALAGAANHATYDAGGHLYSCGEGVYGELGDGTTKESKVPVRVKRLNGASVTALLAGFGNTGALLSDGDYYDWGLDSQGQLGDGTIGTSSDVPLRVKLPHPVTQAFEGGNAPNDGQTLVLLSDGSVYAWGADFAFQLGNEKRVTEPSPVRISPPRGVHYRVVAAGGETSYGVSTVGGVYAWGAGKFGAVGDGTRKTVRIPVKVESGATALISATSNVVAVALRR